MPGETDTTGGSSPELHDTREAALAAYAARQPGMPFGVDPSIVAPQPSYGGLPPSVVSGVHGQFAPQPIG